MPNRYKVLIVYDNQGSRAFDMMTHTLYVSVRPNAPHSVRIINDKGDLVFNANPQISSQHAWRLTLAAVGGFIAKEVTYNG